MAKQLRPHQYSEALRQRSALDAHGRPHLFALLLQLLLHGFHGTLGLLGLGTHEVSHHRRPPGSQHRLPRVRGENGGLRLHLRLHVGKHLHVFLKVSAHKALHGVAIKPNEVRQYLL